MQTNPYLAPLPLSYLRSLSNVILGGYGTSAPSALKGAPSQPVGLHKEIDVAGEEGGGAASKWHG